MNPSVSRKVAWRVFFFCTLSLMITGWKWSAQMSIRIIISKYSWQTVCDEKKKKQSVKFSHIHTTHTVLNCSTRGQTEVKPTWKHLHRSWLWLRFLSNNSSSSSSSLSVWDSSLVSIHQAKSPLDESFDFHTYSLIYCKFKINNIILPSGNKKH